MYRYKVSFSLMIFERLNGEMELIVNYFHYRVPIFLVVSIVWTSGAVPSESQQTPPLSPIYEGKNNCSNYSHRALRDSLGKCTVLCSLFDNYYQDSQRPGCSGWFSDSGGSAKSKLLVKADFFLSYSRVWEREREWERECRCLHWSKVQTKKIGTFYRELLQKLASFFAINIMHLIQAET